MKIIFLLLLDRLKYTNTNIKVFLNANTNILIKDLNNFTLIQNIHTTKKN